MKLRFSRLLLFSMGAVLATVLLAATAVMAQDSSSSDGTIPALFAGGMLLFVLIFVAAFYIYFALALSTNRHQDTHGKPLAGVDPNRQPHFDDKYSQENNLVDLAFFRSTREHCDFHYSLDGRRRSSRQTKLVGDPDYCSNRWNRRTRVFGLGRLRSF
jgi:hypothetical protein